MKREIKFRGKRLDNGEWVEGMPCYNINNGLCIQVLRGEVKNGMAVTSILHPVSPETVGQFTGLKDKNGKEIYEGDIIDINYKYDACGINGVIPDQDCACLGVVLYNKYTAVYELHLIKAEYPIDVKGYDEEYSLNLYSFDLDGYIDLFGNIHDNPELLKTE